MDTPSLTAQADAAAAAGELQRAQGLLLQAVEAAPKDGELLLKLAAIQRAAGKPRLALEAVERALAMAPLDFMALTMRASLLDRLEDPRAGEAWHHALAQRPDGPLPPHLANAVAQGEKRRDAWLDERDLRMKADVAEIEARASAEEQQRIARFRSNILRRTRAYHSEPTHFHYPGLPEREFHPRRLFPWLDGLEAATDDLVAEFEAVMSAERAELVPYIQYPEHSQLDQWRELNNNRDWTAIHLAQNGNIVEANARHCPRAMELLRTFHQPRIAGASPNAMFSLLAPNTAIPPHVGVSNARLVCHLPLIIPDGCWFRVGAETRYWKLGEAFVFDDTIEHEALNPSDQLRVVFIFDVWAPDLTPIEREAVAAMIGSAQDKAPGL
jgi:aspartyl/asparaginyl beta-hydroxylase (cupin superfamily)